jgi:hypothetical protein
MNTMQTSTATAPRRTSLDDFIRLTTEPAPLCGMGYERAAIAAAGLAGEIASVFALLPFAKVGM